VRTLKTALAAVSATIVLAGCGGGGDDAGAAPSARAPAPAVQAGVGARQAAPRLGVESRPFPTVCQSEVHVHVGETFNLDWGLDGVTTEFRYTLLIQPEIQCRDGSIIQFSTEGGQIQTSCRTTGVKSGTSTFLVVRRRSAHRTTGQRTARFPSSPGCRGKKPTRT
jgi:hypothetical protein